MIFDLDGVLVDSETIWDDARRALAQAHDRPWPEDATRAMMGMSSPEWSAYMHDVVGVPLSTDEISREAVAFVAQRYTEHLPLLPGAQEAVRRLAEHWPLGLASSSNRPIIERFLDASGLRQQFSVTVSSEEVERGKPAPDVYLAAAERLGVPSDQCAAIEDSTNGLKAADAAGMKVIAVPNEHFPPDPQTLARATHVISTLDELTPELIRS